MPKKTKSDAETYTKPALRDQVKSKVLAGDKGGKAGQWSARKAQLVAHEYQEEGGGYLKPRNEEQKKLQKWTEPQQASPARPGKKKAVKVSKPAASRKTASQALKSASASDKSAKR